MADRIKLRRGPKSKIDLNVYELGYATDSTEERLYFNNGSMVPIPNNKDITDIKTELTKTTNISNKNKQDVSELKESVAGIIKTGVAKLVQYSYDIELSENTKKVNIPYERYSSVTDTLKVYVNGLAIQNDQYTITDPIENDGIVTNGYIVLKVERPAGTIVRIEVWKNVPSGEEGEVSGNIITKNSLPLDRIIGINDIRNNPNLFINGDFRNPVNQRGKSQYTSNNYCIDRWKKWTDKFTTSVQNGFLRNQGTWIVLLQYLEESPKLFIKGTVFTMSAKVKCEKTRPVKFSYYDHTSSNSIGELCPEITVGTDWKVISHTATVNVDIVHQNTAFCIETSWNDADTATLDIEWIKIELGSVATPFIPRLYAEELALCKRYYEVSNNDVYINAIKQHTSYFGEYKFDVEKRVSPTIECGNQATEGQMYLFAPNNLKLLTPQSINPDTKQVRIHFPLQDNDQLNVGNTCGVTGWIKADAEIY